MTFRKLLPTAMKSWTLQDCKNILHDIRPVVRRVAMYVIKKKFTTLILILITIPSYSQVRRSYIALEATYVTLQVADVALTRKAISMGGEELNPTMRWAIDNKVFIPSKIVLTGLTLYGCRKIYHHDPTAAYVSMIVLNTMYSAVVYNNYQVCVRLKI